MKKAPAPDIWERRFLIAVGSFRSLFGEYREKALRLPVFTRVSTFISLYRPDPEPQPQ